MFGDQRLRDCITGTPMQPLSGGIPEAAELISRQGRDMEHKIRNPGTMHE